MSPPAEPGRPPPFSNQRDRLTLPMRKNNLWAAALKSAADPARAAKMMELLAAKTPANLDLSSESAPLLAALFSGSQSLGAILVANPDWLDLLQPESLRHPRRKQGFRKEIDSWLAPLLQSQDYAAILHRLRQFKNRELLRIGARDLNRLGHVVVITQELSDLADVCLDTVWCVCSRQLQTRLGQPWHRDPAGTWSPTRSCVLGMGKLGGRELNYSSDVDLLFLYTEEGGVFKDDPNRNKKSLRPSLTNHQFFNRVAEAFINEVTRLTGDGALYRIDMRLRPEGDAGPLSRSLAGYENYYAQWGQTWERMMLIKTRGVAGDPSLAAEFLELIQPFRYPRSVNQAVLREIGAMKDRIELEVVKAGELDRNVKLGRGGIREIEFVAQALQLLHGGRQPFLQGPQTLPCLEKLVQYERLSAEDARTLREAYCFLRDVEHRLQMEDNRQTHTIPQDRPAQERLARLMGFNAWKPFEATRRQHTEAVRRIFDRLLKAENQPANPGSLLPSHFEGADAEWANLLGRHGFRDTAKALRVLREFVEGPGYLHVSPRTRELALQLIPRFLALCPGGKPTQPSPATPAAADPLAQIQALLSDPDRVVTRLDSFIAAYGARATMFELWHSNPAIFQLLVLLFDRSEFLAELAIRTPDLVDELVTSGRLRQRKSADETLRDLTHGIADKDQHLWLRRYHQAELTRIGLRDILGLADPEQYLTELSALADASLQYALEVVMRRHKLKKQPFTIIGLGKLGGAEIDYGSDLDIIFVAPQLKSAGAKLSRLALEVLDLLSTRTELGMLFQTDARLRPDGEKGLLVNALPAYEDYYRQRAHLWEIQSLTRSRPVAGDPATGAAFQSLAAQLTNFSQPNLPLNAYAPDWKARIHHMRIRIQNERTPAGKDDLAIKTGVGGLIDAEFIAQALCLEHAWHEPNTLRALQSGQKAGVLPEADSLIQNYRRLRRVEGILRRWSYEGEVVLPDDPAPYYRVAVRCGFPTPEAFRQALAEYRGAVRAAYNQFFPG